jgi:hypothetical protein
VIGVSLSHVSHTAAICALPEGNLTSLQGALIQILLTVNRTFRPASVWFSIESSLLQTGCSSGGYVPTVCVSCMLIVCVGLPVLVAPSVWIHLLSLVSDVPGTEGSV